MVPLPVYGELNVRIKKNGTGSTINVNLVNLYYETVVNKISNKNTLAIFKTTGVFEKALANMVK